MACDIPGWNRYRFADELIRLEPMSIWPIIVMMMLATPAMLLAVLLLLAKK